MTEKDKQELADVFTSVLAAHPQGCPNGIDAVTAATLKELADALREGKKTIRKTIIAALATTILGAIILGIKELFR